MATDTKETEETNEPTLRDILVKLEQLSIEQERFNDRFSNYQQATQWVMQLAFTLIASATLTVIITAVFRR